MSPQFIGYHDEKDLPVKRGDVVTIVKGTTIRTTRPKPEDRTLVAKRTYKVRVNHIMNGITLHSSTCQPGETPGPKQNPSVCWPGTGGYWYEVDINSIPEAQK